MMRKAWSIAALWLLLAAVYLFFAGTLGVVEITSAAIAAALAASLGSVMAAIDDRHFAIQLPTKAVLRPLSSLLPDFFSVGRILLTIGIARSQRGDFVRQPFESGGTDGRSTTRRAAAVIGVSLAPRTFVVRGEDSDELLLHCLPEKAPSQDHMWPA